MARIEFSSQDDSGCNILHIDMDCFFASCEEKINPQIKGKPVIVGSIGNRGVVSAANYEARKFGVHSAMPIKQAQNLCPNGIFLRTHMGEYKNISKKVFEIFAKYTDKIEPLSIDEAFLDVSEQIKILGSPREIAEKIRADIKTELGLIASVGVAENMFLAKIASDKSKPNGLLVIPKNESLSFLHSLPISAIWGLGGKNQKILKNKGYVLVKDLFELSLDNLKRLLGDALGYKVFNLSHGIDERKVGETIHDKSVSNERTFSKDIYEYEVLRNELLYLSKKCGFSIRSKEFLAKTISVKIKFTDFTTMTRDKTLSMPTCDDETIFDTVLMLLEKIDYHKGVRLVGVKVSNLLDKSQGVPQVLFENSENLLSDSSVRKENVLKVSDELKVKYGEGIILPASLLKHKDK